MMKMITKEEGWIWSGLVGIWLSSSALLRLRRCLFIRKRWGKIRRMYPATVRRLTSKSFKATAWKMTFDSFSEHFDKQNLTVTSANGKDLMSSGYVGTGSTVTINVNGSIIDTATVCLAGDVNCNGSLDVGDYILIKRACMNTYKLNEVQAVAADVYGNDGIDVFDYMLVRRYFFNPNAEIFGDFTK